MGVLKRDASPFARRVLSVICRIPAGQVASYGEVATAAGFPGAARAVGAVLRTQCPPGVPAHRVIAAQGRLGGYGGNLPLKRALLVQEGVVVAGDKVRDWRARTWCPARPTREDSAARTRADGRPSRVASGRRPSARQRHR